MAFGSGHNNKGSISEINVTPLVDVMLVLLVIFMITAPLVMNGIKLDLPKTKEVNPINLNKQQVILSFTKEREYYLGKDKVLFKELVERAQIQFKENGTEVLFLRADFSIPYGEVAKLMSHLKRGGVSQVALVTETEK